MILNMIKNIRKQLGLTQIELAKELNTTQGQISHLEVGRISVSKDFADLIINIAARNGIKVTYNDIFSEPNG